MNTPTFLCVDCGTTVIKATLTDDLLHPIDEAKRPVNVYCPYPSHSEADMQEIWESLCEITQELAARNPDAWKSLVGMGISGQGDGLWPVDANNKPAGRALLWNDTRSRGIDFDNMKGIPEAIHDNHTNQIFAGSVLALMRWMKSNRTSEYENIRWALHCKDWLNLCLTGIVATDYSDASTCAYDHVNGCYAKDLFVLTDMEDALEKMPPLHASTDILGKVTAQAAKLTGIPEGLPVLEGAIDVCAVAVGTDILSPGRSCTIIGTTLSCQIALKKEDIRYDNQQGLLVHHAIPHLYMRVLPTLSGSSTMDFAKNLFFPDVGYPELERKISKLPIGSEGLIYHPYICGERAPIKNPFATAGFFGLTQTHTTLHMMRSVFEGLACSFYDCYQVLEGYYNCIYLSGGASVSPVVCQMFCDMIGLPCRRVNGKEQGTLGIGRLLQVALGYKKSFDDFMDQSAIVYNPDMQKHEEYMRIYPLFKKLQNGMTDFWRERMSLVDIHAEE